MCVLFFGQVNRLVIIVGYGMNMYFFGEQMKWAVQKERRGESEFILKSQYKSPSQEDWKKWI